MDQQLVATVEAKHDKLEQSTCVVEAEPELAGRVLLIQVGDVHAVLCREESILCRNPVIQPGSMNLHYAASIHALTAARMASDRDT